MASWRPKRALYGVAPLCETRALPAKTASARRWLKVTLMPSRSHCSSTQCMEWRRVAPHLSMFKAAKNKKYGKPGHTAPPRSRGNLTKSPQKLEESPWRYFLACSMMNPSPPSTMRNLKGPKIWAHEQSIASVKVEDSLSLISTPACHLSARSSWCQTR